MNRSITKLSIRGLGVFRDFTWTDHLPLFARYNLIYGWNGSGKTLISNVFAALQSGRKLDAGTAILELSNGERVSDEDFPEWSQRLQVRVFNRDFVNKNVFGTQGELGPIFVLGEKSREAQQELDRLKGEVTKKEGDLRDLENRRREKEKELDRFCSDSARYIRDTLRGPGQDDYANYERPQFKRAADLLLGRDQYELILDGAKFSELLVFIGAERRSNIQLVKFSFEAARRLAEEARSLCGLSITGRVIEDLKARPDVNNWVRDGLELHRKHSAEKCLFCNQQLPEERIRTLEGHFSDQYSRLVRDIELLIQKVRKSIDEAQSLQLPDEAKFYPDLQQHYRDCWLKLGDMLKKYLETLMSIQSVLETKKSDPFERYDNQILPVDFGDEAVQKINEIIKEHNERVENHEERVRDAKKQIETSIVAERLPDYTRLKDEIAALDSKIAEAKALLDYLQHRQRELERSLTEHRRPVEELNQDLASYLGHSEIQLEVSETGYRIMRNGTLAESLSEGEQTAIAFLYFLKTLEDKDFNKGDGIVVVDDPVSSLDSNFLYCAFGFMKSRLKNTGQLFVLTHNFLFFRAVKRWFDWIAKKQPKDKDLVRYYMLEATTEDGVRKSRLFPLDPLLKDFESEYHYLFSLVYEASTGSGNNGLAQYHNLPNVARRLLEAFLEFRAPGGVSLYDKLELIPEEMVDPAKKARICRFCDAHSHLNVIDDIDQDPVILGEGPSIAKDVMELIKAVDTSHFDQMVKLINKYSGGSKA
ncbi:MAG: AAA family ATPase [Firmicutes bacterium]|nr:AAA family ATPase [Bacillota bacterium]